MMRFFAIAALLVAGAASAAPAYKSANFTGGLNNVTASLQARLTAAGYDASLFQCFSCGTGATSVGGNLIFDSSIPVPPSPPNPALENVFSISPISGVAASDVFTFAVGPIVMHIGDTGVGGGPAIQYNNGVFNGIFFAEDFTSPNGTQTLRFNAQGPTFSLIRLSDRGILFSGFIDTTAGLTNVQDFPPAAAIPEPEIYTMLMAGFGLIGFIARRRRIGPK
jgi:hypothetical protein